MSRPGGVWLAVALLTVSVTTPAASEPAPRPSAPTAYEILHLPDAPPSTSLKSPPASKLTAGDLAIVLERTTLKTVQARFGGHLYWGGDAAGSVTWLCYAKTLRTGGAVVYWFISNNEMGGGTGITQVAVQRLASAPDRRCAPAPARLTGIDFDAPSIGASLAGVREHFGGGRPADGYLSYENEIASGPKANQATTVRSLVYHFEDGVVNTISVEQVTST